MRAVVQRVTEASVTVDGNIIGRIKKGLLVLLGAQTGDTKDDICYLADKILNLRIFQDENDKMNLSCLDIKGEILIVPQFTLLGDVRRGRRPDFTGAENPGEAKKLYEIFVEVLKESGLNIKTGQFSAMMDVGLINNGPVTILLDSRKNF